MNTSRRSTVYVKDPRRARRVRRRGAGASMLARQVDRVIREPEGDFIDREIGVRNVLQRKRCCHSVAAEERHAAVLVHGQIPDLEPLGRDLFLEALGQSDLVDQNGVVNDC